MAEEVHRNPGDTAAYGYRQLPGAGNSRGIDLKTLTYGVFGVAMGIVVGTLAADGTLKAMFSAASLHSVQASTIAPKPPASPALKTAQTPAPEVHAALKSVQTPPFEVPAVLKTVQTPHLDVHAATPVTAKPVPGLKSAETKTPVLNVSTTGKPRPVHRHVSRRRHSGRRRIHSRHRGHSRSKTKAIKDLNMKPKVKDSVVPANLFTFMTEGDVTVASYDASLGRIDTFEGESFALNQIARLGDIVPLDAFPGSLHYRCDQSWNCTLFRDGASIISARRTK